MFSLSFTTIGDIVDTQRENDQQYILGSISMNGLHFLDKAMVLFRGTIDQLELYQRDDAIHLSVTRKITLT